MKILLTLFQRVSLLCLLSLATYTTASASHNVGCAITYTCLGNNQYQFTMTCYRDCNGISMPSSTSLTFNNNGSCPGTVNPLTLDTVGALSAVDVSQLCNPTTSSCQGGSQQGTQQWVYQGIVTLPAGCIWTASYGTCCRSSAITNLQGPGGAGTYVSTTINTSVTPCNNSVQFSNLPIIYTCDSTLTNYNHGATDPDGDTLVFSLVDPQTNPPANIPFVAGLSATNPLSLVPTTTFQFDSTTGQMVFIPEDNAPQVAIVAMKVEEIRNGVVIATTIREVQIVVLTNCNNDPPAVDSNGVQGSAITINGSSLELCRGHFASFELIIQDPNGDSLTVTSNIITAVPGAVVSYNVDDSVIDSVVVTFTVNSINLTPGIYPFVINVNDNACPVPSVQFLGYALRIYGANYTNNIYCRNDADPVPIIIGDSMGVFLGLGTNPAGLVLDSITGVIDLDSSAIGTYDIVYTLDSVSICPSDSIQITIVDVPNPAFSYPAALWCRQGVDLVPTITGTPGGTFNSDAGVAINSITGVVDISNTTLGSHVIYYNVVGGTCSAQDSFIIDVMELDAFGATSSQYFICPNVFDTIQLGVNVSYNGTLPPTQTYLWSPNSNIIVGNVNSQTLQVNILTPETYYLEYNDGLCPTLYDTIEITAPYPASIDPTSNIVLCNGNAAQIGASVASGPGSQTFSHTGVTTVQTEDTSYFTINVSGIAPSSINGALLASLGICFDININSLAHVTAHLIAPSGQSAVLTAGNGGLNTVLTNATFSTAAGNALITSLPFFPPTPVGGSFFPQGGVAGFNSLLGATTNGTWTLMIIHNNGGLGTGTGTLNDWCLNFQDLSASTFAWSPNNSTISCVLCDSPTVSPAVNTTYTVVATNLFGCTDTATVDVVIDTALPSPVTVCGNATSNSVTFNWVPVFGAAGYVATVDGGAPQILGANLDSLQVTGLSSGQCVTLIIYPQSGNTCADGAPDTIVCCATSCGAIDPIVISPSGPTTFCVGQSVTLDAGAGANSYLWSTSPTDINQTVTVSTTQLVSVTTTDINGCLDTGSVLITVVPGPTPTIVASGSTTLCSGDSVTLDAGAGYVGYAWNPTGAAQIITANTSGTYYVTVTDAVGCIGFDSMVVTVGTPLLVPTTGVDLSCNGVSPVDGSATVTPSGSFPTYTYNWSNGQTNATATALPTGAICVTVTDANACTATSCVTISEPSAVSVSTVQTNVTCFNGSDGTATATGSGGAGSYTYNWSPSGQTNATATGLGAGVHCVTITDASGCTVDTCITITQPAVTVTSTATITSSFPNGSPISCGGTCDGQATATGLGGTPSVSGYTYVWSTTPVQNTAIATGLCVGPYQVTVTDSLGCSSISSVTFTEPAPVTVTISSSTIPSCNGATDAQAVAVGSGGAGGYNYAWNTSPVQLTDTASNLGNGIYTVTATDVNGCTGTNSVTITEPTAVSATTAISSTYNGASISCNGACDGAITATGAGGTGAYSFVWSNGQTNAIATALCAGAYTVTVSDANGCATTSSITITEPTAVSATSTSTNVSCNGGSDGQAVAVGAGGTGVYSYVWSTIPAQSAATAVGLDATTSIYTATVSDANGCATTTTVTITEPSQVTATISTTAVSCNGGSDGTATATVGGGTATYTYAWGNAVTTTNATVLGQAAGAHSMTITDANGCSIVENYIITEPSAISFTISSVDASCFGASDGTATINASGGVGGFTYAWNSSAQNTATATGLSAGVHCVTVTDTNGCTVDTCIQVGQPAGFSNITFSTINVSCFGGSNGQATISLSGGIAPYTYVWSAAAQTGPTATGLDANTHIVTVTDNNGCTVVANVAITQPTALQLAFDADSVLCKNGNDGQLEALVTGGTFPYTYQWDASAGLQMTAIATGLTVGNYSVVVTDFNGCTITGNEDVFEPQTVLTAAIINQSNPLCHNSCDGMIEVDAQGATPNYTYNWNNGQNTSIASGVCAGVHTVTVTDANGCSTTAGSVLTAPAAISLIPQVLSNFNGAAISCPGENDGSVGVTAAGGNGGFSYIWSPMGQNTATINNLVQGTYCVTVTDVSGCEVDTCITISDPVPLAASFTKVDILCHGDANGQILVNATTGTGTLGTNGYEYKITGPGQSGNVYSSTNNWNNLVGGSYVVYVRDGNNCELLLPIEITEPDPVLIDSVVVSNALCHGTATGTATAHVSGGVGGYTYLWSNNQTQNPATGLAAGLYSVTVSDANGCDRVDVFNVGEPTAVTATIAANSIPCFGGNTTATVTAGGGTPLGLGSYVYVWSNGNTNSTAIGLSAGVHCVTVTDANACTYVACVTITQPSTALTVSATASDATCNGAATGTATATGAGGTAGYTYQWDANAANQTGATATGLTAGNYTVTVTDANGCTSNTTVTVGEPNPVVATITGTTNAACNGTGSGTATAAGSGGTAGYTYQWDANAANQTGATATNLGGGSYAVTVTDANGCTAVATATVISPAAVDITSITTTPVSCNGGNDGTAFLTIQGGTPAYSYQWSGAPGQNTQIVSGLPAGSQTVIAVDANGCSDTASFTISEPAQGLTGYLTAADALCFGSPSGELGAVVQGGTGTYTYAWNSSPAQSSVVADSLIAGTYIVTISDANGCSLELTGTVAQPTQLVVTATVIQDVSCAGGNNGAALVNSTTGGTPGYAYVWTDPSGQIGAAASNLSAGVISVIATDANTCTASATLTITEGAPITLTETVNNISCNGLTDGSINITGSNSLISTYTWSNSTVGVPNAGLAAGVYDLTVTDVVGCMANFSYTITEPSPVNLDLVQVGSILCHGAGNASASVTPAGGTPTYSIAWSNGSTAPLATNLAPATHSVTVTDANGCSADSSFVISQPEALIISGSTTGTLCAGDQTGTLTAIGSGGTVISGLLEYSIDGTTWQNGNIFSGLTAGIYTLSVKDENNCISDTMLTVEDADPFFISSMTPNQTIEYLDSLTIEVVLNDTMGVTFNWTQISGVDTVNNDSLYSFGIAPEDPVQYQFTATNASGCSLDSIVIIEVEKPRRAAAPTGFTPNGDGVNDYFFIQGGEKVQEVTIFRIYDRWGELVFEGNNSVINVPEQGWDGIFRGQPATSGIYTWYADVLFKDGETKQVKGSINLLR